MCLDNRTYTMQLTNETALPIAWIEAEGDSWGCDEEDCEYGEVRSIYIYSNTVIIVKPRPKSQTPRPSPNPVKSSKNQFQRD